MEYLSRTKIYEKKPIARDAKKVYVFCEGAVREVNYFRYFEGLSSNISIVPIPCKEHQSDPIKLMTNARLLIFGDDNTLPLYTLSKEFKDEVWFVIDTDTWQEQGKISDLKGFCVAHSTEANPWLVAQSNPCFELWLLYHYFGDLPLDEDVAACESFKDYVGKKVTGGVDVRKAPLLLMTAIGNSTNNFRMEGDYPAIYSTALHDLGNVIQPFIADQLEKGLKMIAEFRTKMAGANK